MNSNERILAESLIESIESMSEGRRPQSHHHYWLVIGGGVFVLVMLLMLAMGACSWG